MQVTIEPFSFGNYAARDIQDADPGDQHEIVVALRDGMVLIPAQYKCDALGLSPDGDYVAMLLGVYSAGTLIGAWWLGAHEAAPGHTAESAKVYSHLCPGPVPKHEEEFWNGALALVFVKHLLTNVMPTREGGTVEFVGFDYAFGPGIEPGSPASILPDIDALAVADAELQVARTDIEGGGTHNRWTLAP